jgi:hypothetical protein
MVAHELLRFSAQSSNARKGGTAMTCQLCVPYRGCTIDVEVQANNVVSLSGREFRYYVAWSIHPSDALAAPTASFPERLDFLTPDEAFSYGERRAHTFIDGCMSPSDAE